MASICKYTRACFYLLPFTPFLPPSPISLSLSFYLASFAPLSLSLPPDRSSAPTPPRATSGSQQLNPAASALRRPQVLAEPREAPAGLEPPARTLTCLCTSSCDCPIERSYELPTHELSHACALLLAFPVCSNHIDQSKKRVAQSNLASKGIMLNAELPHDGRHATLLAALPPGDLSLTPTILSAPSRHASFPFDRRPPPRPSRRATSLPPHAGSLPPRPEAAAALTPAPPPPPPPPPSSPLSLPLYVLPKPLHAVERHLLPPI